MLSAWCAPALLFCSLVFSWRVYQMIRHFSRAGLMCCSLVLILSPGCVAEPEPSPGDVTQQVGQSLRDDEIIAWAEQLEAEVQAGNLDLSEILDLRAMLEFATASSDAVEPMRSDFITAALNQWQTKQGLVATLVKRIEAEAGSYRLLRLQEVEGVRWALFRVLDSEGQINYHRFRVARQADRVTVVDVETVRWGESVSQTVRRMYLAMADDANRGWIDSFFGETSAYVTHQAELVRLCEQVENQQYTEALQTYDTLPETLQCDKTALLARITAAQALDDPASTEMLTHFRQRYPRDRSWPLLLLDFSLLDEDHAGALRAIEQLDQFVGGDPYLHMMRAHVYSALDDFATARIALRRAIDEEPDLLAAYGMLLNLALEHQDHDETLQMLRVLSTRFDAQFDELTLFPEYDTFTESPQYQQWRAFQNGR